MPVLTTDGETGVKFGGILKGETDGWRDRAWEKADVEALGHLGGLVTEEGLDFRDRRSVLERDRSRGRTKIVTVEIIQANGAKKTFPLLTTPGWGDDLEEFVCSLVKGEAPRQATLVWREVDEAGFPVDPFGPEPDDLANPGASQEHQFDRRRDKRVAVPRCQNELAGLGVSEGVGWARFDGELREAVEEVFGKAPLADRQLDSGTEYVEVVLDGPTGERSSRVLSVPPNSRIVEVRHERQLTCTILSRKSRVSC